MILGKLVICSFVRGLVWGVLNWDDRSGAKRGVSGKVNLKEILGEHRNKNEIYSSNRRLSISPQEIKDIKYLHLHE